MTTLYVCERTTLHGCVGYFRCVIDVLGLKKSVVIRKCGHLREARSQDATTLCRRRHRLVQDGSLTYIARGRVCDVCSWCSASPPWSFFFLYTLYTQSRFFFDVRARYGARFERAMRMSDKAFNGLLSVLRPRLPRRGLCAEARTAIAFRYLGGGSYIDICAAFGVHTATVYRSLWDFVDAVNSSPVLALDFQLADSTRRPAYAARFQSGRNSPFGSVVGALDGIGVDQEQPLASDITCVADYYSRKGYYAFNVQATCDADYKLRWMSCRSPGETHDSAAFTCTCFGQSFSRPDDPLTSSLVRDGPYISADEAYAASEVLGVPCPGGGKGDLWRDAYNF